MAVQFAGSGSTADRRRRRLAVGADANVDNALLEGDGGDIESQLVASAAAAPWVPVTELRIWIYTTLISFGLAAMTFLLLRPIELTGEVSLMADHLLGGPHPMLVACFQTSFLGLSTQLAILICWYRARCKLDFGGRYRVWPWVVGLLAIATFFTATDLHQVLGGMAGHSAWLPWRGATVAWLLPFCIAGLPIGLLIDRDVRNSISSLVVLRFSGLLWLTSALLEIYRPELESRPGFSFVNLFVPLYASATSFIGFWLHARVVAYVCPDPPELDQPSAWSVIRSALAWILCRLLWKSANIEPEADDEEDKPKRRRKKAEGDETATRRKRRTPAKRSTSRVRTKTKSTNEDEADESGEAASDAELESGNPSVEGSSTFAESSDESVEDSTDEPMESPTLPTRASNAKNNDRVTEIHNSHGPSVPAPHSRFQANSWTRQAPVEESDQEASSPAAGSNDDSDDDQQDSDDVRISPEQLKGLSKRQKRDLKKQLREQQRARGH